jgi:MoaA/NifB/PqqE/SkfB family radical SAM enzyme
MLVITGGEPFLWTDGRYNVEDVVMGARYLGFFRTVVCTNGTLGLTSSADYLWVSLDGLLEEHNRMRGEVYDRVVGRIARSGHPRIYINFTISNENVDQLPDSAEQMLHLPNVRGILFHIFTPYLGADKDLALDTGQRKAALDTLRRLKRRHPLMIMNTFDGIRLLRSDRWERPVWSSVVVNDGQISPCCCRAGIADEDVCRNCGCSPAVETFALQTARPLAALEWLRFL